METTLSARACIRYGWETFKKRPWFFVGTTLLLTAISMIIPGTDEYDPWSKIIAIFIVSSLLNTFLELAAKHLALRAHDNVEGVRFKDLWRPDIYLPYLGASILVLLAVMAGFILLIIPGIIVGLGLSLTGYLVIDKGLGPVAAIKESWRLTKGHKWQILGFVALMALVNVLGFVLLIVGLLVTLPVTALAFAHLYRTLSGTLAEPVVVVEDPASSPASQPAAETVVTATEVNEPALPTAATTPAAGTVA
jgi:hypothetical protein